MAVLAVVGFHAFPETFSGGYVGVDVFFVLSGFLITSLLLGDIERHGKVRIGRFYCRRVLRLLPALWLVCLLVLLAGVVSGSVDRVARGAVAALFYAANWYIYTGHDAALLEHTWTLAIEEHFYLAWPWLLVFAARLIGPSRPRRLVIVVGVVAGLVTLTLLVQPWPTSFEAVRASYLRGVPIVWGAAIALWRWARRWDDGRSAFGGADLPASSGPVVGVLGATAAIGILSIVCRPDLLGLWSPTGPLGAVGLLSVPLVVSAIAASQTPVQKALSWDPLRWVGERAYGIYLLHFPVISILWHQVPATVDLRARMILAIGGSLLLAGLMYRWVETPFLRVKARLA